MDDAVSCIQYLQAAFPLDGELALSQSTARFLEHPDSTVAAALRTLDATVCLTIQGAQEPLKVDLSLPLQASDPPLLSIQHPAFLTRSQHEQLLHSLSPVQTVDDVYVALDEIKPAAEQLIEDLKAQEHSAAAAKVAKPRFSGPMVRAWFWFIMITTREKRNDVTQWAAHYGLTGFLLAGKPGILCLEGRADAIDAYWKDIKTSSWAEIPSFQKKVTERHREPLQEDGSDRKFATMEEIDVTRRGSKGHRGNMGELYDWMQSHGVEHAFDKVVLSSNS